MQCLMHEIRTLPPSPSLILGRGKKGVGSSASHEKTINVRPELYYSRRIQKLRKTAAVIVLDDVAQRLYVGSIFRTDHVRVSDDTIAAFPPGLLTRIFPRWLLGLRNQLNGNTSRKCWKV